MKRKIIAFVMMLIVVIPSVFLFSGCNSFGFGSNNNSGSSTNNSSNDINNKTNINVNFDSFYPFGEISYDYDIRYNSGTCRYCILLMFTIIRNFYSSDMRARIDVYEKELNGIIFNDDDIQLKAKTDYIKIYGEQHVNVHITALCYYDILPSSVTYIAKNNYYYL